MDEKQMLINEAVSMIHNAAEIARQMFMAENADRKAILKAAVVELVKAALEKEDTHAD